MMPIGRSGTEKREPVGAGTTHELFRILGVDALGKNFFRPSLISGIAFAGIAFTKALISLRRSTFTLSES
jgi:hypothetical protein